MVKRDRDKDKSKKRSMKDRYKEDYKSRDAGGFQGSNILDLSKAGEVEWYKIKKGSNELDVIPYEVSTNQHPQGVKKGELDYKLDVWVHRNAGAIEGRTLCLKKTFNKKCPICEDIQKMIESDEYTWKDDVIKALKPSRRCIYNVIDLTGDSDDIQLFEISHFEFQKEIIEEAQDSAEGEGEIIPFADLEDGATIKFRGVEREGDFSGFKPKGYKLLDREAYKEAVLEDTFALDELLIIPSYDEIKKAFLGEEDEEDDVPDDDEKPAKSKKKKTRRVVDEDEEDEEDDAPDEDEEEKSTKSKKEKSGNKKASRRRTKQEVDEEDEEEDEEEEKSTKSKKKNSTKEKSKKGKCPDGHTFGDDCDEYDECEDCDSWDACARRNSEE